MTDTVLAQAGGAEDRVDARPEAAMARALRQAEPPPYNRRFLESRLAYRIQELAYGGLKPETVRRLEALGEELDGGKREMRRKPAPTTGRSPARG